jgi:hypothetical protein
MTIYGLESLEYKTETTIYGIGTALYGHAKKQELFGDERIEAERGGYLPYSYQVIKWFTLAWLPIIPLGTYRVMKEKVGFWTPKLPHYKLFPADWDWAQVLRHYLIAYGWAILLFLLSLAFGHTP